MRTGPIGVFKGAIDAQARVAYIQALTTAEATDRAAGDTVASNTVKNNGAEHYIHNDHLDIALNLASVDELLAMQGSRKSQAFDASRHAKAS